MNGLALAKEYFDMVGRPMIEKKFPGVKSRIAAGLVGMGSDCLGFDDRLSRDHDWGPGFCLWLGKDDYNCIGLDLQESYDALPGSYRGIRRNTSRWGRGRLGVHEICGFYRSFVGLSGAPQRLMEWLVVPECNLAACVSGKVFVDPSGEFSEVRNKILSYYPEDVRLKKIAARCMSAAQAGQYNYTRCLERSDLYAAWSSLVTFCEDVMALVYLLNRKYMPYFKWHCKGAAELPVLGQEISQAVSVLCQGNNHQTQQDVISTCCEAVAGTLKIQGLSREVGSDLLEHGPAVQNCIKDKELEQLDVWYRGG